ncbi:cystatin-A-like [Hoplias malabaricus]|uniref:cystatin-A-like n=1 Tax=Hoplias malabaricus TaxID=27720 RepID=UPI0034636663
MASRFCLLLVVVLFAIAESSVPGGWSEWKNADRNVNEICRKLKPEVEKQLGERFSRFEALTYQTQVVKGLNYKIKVYAGVNKLVIMQVYQGLCQNRLKCYNLKNVAVFLLPATETNPVCVKCVPPQSDEVDAVEIVNPSSTESEFSDE